MISIRRHGPLALAATLCVTTLAVAKDIRDVKPEDASFLRVVGDDVVALEIASRRYSHAEGPDVTLAGVVHIGDRKYYRQLQRFLDSHDVVLYESVKPAGTGGAGGETLQEQQGSTRAALEYVAGVVEAHHDKRDAYPPSLAAVKRFAADAGGREAAFLEMALVDAWGNAVRYAVDDASYRLTSNGADGSRGGEGEDADIVVDTNSFMSSTSSTTTSGADSGDGLQLELARALNLDFQLEAIDYDGEQWRCSDMSLDQLSRAMDEAGSDFSVIEGTLAGTSFPARFVRLLLGMLRMADAFMGGALSDTFKVVLVEMLGDETMINAALTQADPAFAEVIINDRNQVVVDDLAQLIESEPEVESIAVFYGAGHMADFAKRLADLGYTPTETTWHRAIEIDLAESAVSKAELNRMRFMVRRSMRQMYGGMGK